jgi:hypothetical protein
MLTVDSMSSSSWGAKSLAGTPRRDHHTNRSSTQELEGAQHDGAKILLKESIAVGLSVALIGSAVLRIGVSWRS